MRLTAVALGIAVSSVSPALACGPEEFVGSICMSGRGICPHGYLEAYGQELPIHDHDQLFAAIGTTFGGDGVRTFKLPDLRGREIAGDNPTGANGLPATSLGAVIAAKNDLGSTDKKGQALVVKFCIAAQGVFPARP